MSTIFAALAGAERVFRVMDTAPEAPDRENAAAMTQIEGNVVLDNVTFGYVPEKTILKHISLDAKPGQKIAFVGSTGAGKTTITNLLNRFSAKRTASKYCNGSAGHPSFYRNGNGKYPVWPARCNR